MKKNITILGATGSIGLSTLNVLSQHLHQFKVFALTSYHKIENLVQLCIKFHPEYVVLRDEKSIKLFQELLPPHLKTKVLLGEEGLIAVSETSETDIVMSAIVGAAGLKPTLAALLAGKKVLLANKESLVMAGSIMLNAVKTGQAQLIPVDSEHNGIFQCLPIDFCHERLFFNHFQEFEKQEKKEVEKIILTASGGAVRNLAISELSAVQPDFAVTHPNWSMGPKISVDSASMMNKALEIIEAYYLFGFSPEKIKVILHPQSIIHALVYYEDHSVIAQMGQADMKIPISYALNWPNRLNLDGASLDLISLSDLSFSELDLKRYPCLSLGYQVLEQGGSAAVILNAANEIAVKNFLEKKIKFTDIFYLNRTVLDQFLIRNVIENLEEIIEIDHQARLCAEEWVKKKI